MSQTHKERTIIELENQGITYRWGNADHLLIISESTLPGLDSFFMKFNTDGSFLLS